MKKLFLYTTIVLPGLLLSYLPASAANAGATISKGLEETNKGVGFSKASATQIIGQLIQVLLSVTGIVFLIITIYAGILYMTAAGDESKVKKAKSMLVTSVIGIIIIMSAYALSQFVIGQLTDAVTIVSPEA
jgi:hypothetical protein